MELKSLIILKNNFCRILYLKRIKIELKHFFLYTDAGIYMSITKLTIVRVVKLTKQVLNVLLCISKQIQCPVALGAFGKTRGKSRKKHLRCAGYRSTDSGAKVISKFQFEMVTHLEFKSGVNSKFGCGKS